MRTKLALTSLVTVSLLLAAIGGSAAIAAKPDSNPGKGKNTSQTGSLSTGTPADKVVGKPVDNGKPADGGQTTGGKPESGKSTDANTDTAKDRKSVV